MECEEKQCPECGEPVEPEPGGGFWPVCRCKACGWHGRYSSCTVVVVNNRTDIMRDEENASFNISDRMDELEKKDRPDTDENDF